MRVLSSCCYIHRCVHLKMICNRMIFTMGTGIRIVISICIEWILFHIHWSGNWILSWPLFGGNASLIYLRTSWNSGFKWGFIHVLFACVPGAENYPGTFDSTFHNGHCRSCCLSITHVMRSFFRYAFTQLYETWEQASIWRVIHQVRLSSRLTYFLWVIALSSKFVFRTVNGYAFIWMKVGSKLSYEE